MNGDAVPYGIPQYASQAAWAVNYIAATYSNVTAAAGNDALGNQYTVTPLTTAGSAAWQAASYVPVPVMIPMTITSTIATTANISTYYWEPEDRGHVIGRRGNIEFRAVPVKLT